MTEFLPVALLALSVGDSLPPALRPLHAVDDACLAWTVAQATDSTHTWRLGPGVTVEAVIESPGEGEVLVLFVPRDGEGSTGVDPLPPAQEPDTPGTGCGRILSWR